MAIKTLLVVVIATLEPFQYFQSVVTAGLTLALVWIYFRQVQTGDVLQLQDLLPVCRQSHKRGCINRYLLTSDAT